MDSRTTGMRRQNKDSLDLLGPEPLYCPTQQRTCNQPSGLRNDVKRSGNRLVAGSFDRFATRSRLFIERAIS